MNYSLNNGTLTIELSGKLDTLAASSVEREAFEIIGSNEFDNLIIDCEKLDYISSTGLRVILKIKKEYDELKLINVNKDIYDIFDVTGFSKIITIEKAFRKLSIDGCEIIGQGAKGTIYRLNEDTIVKVYNDTNALSMINHEKVYATKVFVLGIPTAISYDIVDVNGKYGAIFELIDSKSLSYYIVNDPKKFDTYVAQYAELLKNIHATIVDDTIPSVVPYVRKWLNLDAKILSQEEYQKVDRMIEEVSDRRNLLHMDYHTNNVMLVDGEATLIDMDTVSYGHPIFDLGNIVTSNDLFSIFPGSINDFLKMDLDTAYRFLDGTLKAYFGDKYCQENVDKAYLCGYLRLAHHCLRRNMDDEIINKIKEKLSFYIKKVNTLDF